MNRSTTRHSERPARSDLDLMLAVERTRRRNRVHARRRIDRQSREDRDLWSAYVLDGPARARAANEPPPEIA